MIQPGIRMPDNYGQIINGAMTLNASVNDTEIELFSLLIMQDTNPSCIDNR
jgi:hypothetical protein